ncbi:MAG: flagellar basal body P-ring formation chaperone FlgA [bacterium]|nr:flagellar basal body P-ring formation chaperone FlgA [bacterium]
MKARHFSSWTPPGVRHSRGVSPIRHVSYDTLTLPGVEGMARRDRSPRWLVLAISMLVFIPGTQLFAYSLYLQDKVSVAAGPVRLGDIARVDGEQEAGRISGKLLFQDLRAPRYIGAAQLKQSLGAKGPENLERVYGSGTWIIPLGRELNAADLEALLKKQIAALPGGAELYDSAALRLAQNSRIQVPAAGVRLVFRLPARASSLTPGKRIIPLDILPIQSASRGNTVFARHQIQIAIFKKQPVAVATRDLPVGHRLTPGDFRMEVRELDNDEIRYATGELLNRRVMSATKSGAEFTTSNVQVMPAVRRGQSLSLVYQRPGLVFRVRSVALQAGEIGQVIPVRVLYPAANKSRSVRRLSARIVNETTAVFEAALAEDSESGDESSGEARTNVSIK